ncbi:MAG: hypothetical protein HQL14_04110 [Candidatus Omnitrophica bacterium]|nr:hypothetical protein [Candidatus Omnitrophota bacterium]
MFQSLFRRQEDPVPPRNIRVIYGVFVTTVLLFYLFVMVSDHWKFGMAAELIKKARITIGAMLSPAQ